MIAIGPHTERGDRHWVVAATEDEWPLVQNSLRVAVARGIRAEDDTAYAGGNPDHFRVEGDSTTYVGLCWSVPKEAAEFVATHRMGVLRLSWCPY